MDQTKHPQITFLVIWFGIFSGLFVILQILGDGLSSLTGDFQIRSFPLMLVGFVPIAIGMTSRMLVLPQTRSDPQFVGVLIISLAVCEFFLFASIFLFPSEFTTEKAFSFIGTVLGVAVLCPLGIGRNDGELP